MVISQLVLCSTTCSIIWWDEQAASISFKCTEEPDLEIEDWESERQPFHQENLSDCKRYKLISRSFWSIGKVGRILTSILILCTLVLASRLKELTKITFYVCNGKIRYYTNVCRLSIFFWDIRADTPAKQKYRFLSENTCLVLLLNTEHI